MIRDEERQRGSAREGEADRLWIPKTSRICRMSNLSCSLFLQSTMLVLPNWSKVREKQIALR